MIKALRSDRGDKYMSEEFLDHLMDRGMVSQFTQPYTPHYNGVFERRNQTLLDIVRSMMNLKFLEKNYLLQESSGRDESLDEYQEPQTIVPSESFIILCDQEP
ncbi:retrotransposon protein, putative, ty1-copia subclass [Tanacetum coccineum]